MSRPKGSKNKVQSQAAKEQLTAPVVEKQKRSASKPVTLTTTESVLEESLLSSGKDCAKPATTILVVKGFVNIQKNPSGGYYCGGDIHETLEKAKSVASKPTITQLYVAFEVKE